ncbi:MAG: glycosyl transferase family protein [Bryobacteraceae bacterium]|nr:glycosyl transferase family protein [Bryobacteraceae bacterium]
MPGTRTLVVWSAADEIAAALLAPLAIYILLSGLDDLWIDLVWIFRCDKWAPPPAPGIPEKRIAILLPLWREADVIGRMLDHNLAANRYRNFEIFAGAYPNDEETVGALRALERRHARLHVCVLPHDGPTSKSDNLNWIYQFLLLYERRYQDRFEILITHDAEDLIDADALSWINAYCDRHDMVQVPVLALPTPPWEWTHGVYCDEFAEYQARDMRVRSRMGAFVPSTGVGTGYRRGALEKLAEEDGGRIFEPSALTEDYVNGVRLRRLGASQIALPVLASPVATREFFPRTFGCAVRQRTRWVSGIALQGWERFGWGRTWMERYWFWRDRKGLIGNPLSILANFIFIYGLMTLGAAHFTGQPWRLGASTGELRILLAATLLLQIWRTAVRAYFSRRVYGWRFALLVPARQVAANVINCCAVILAIQSYVQARRRGTGLAWLKTAHAYPAPGALAAHQRSLTEVLAAEGFLTARQLRQALESKPEDVNAGDHLVRLGLLTEEELADAVARQNGMERITGREMLRCLPVWVMDRWSVVPVEIQQGAIVLAVCEPPCDELTRNLAQFTSLKPEYRLTTRRELARLMGERGKKAMSAGA